MNVTRQSLMAMTFVLLLAILQVFLPNLKLLLAVKAIALDIHLDWNELNLQFLGSVNHRCSNLRRYLKAL